MNESRLLALVVREAYHFTSLVVKACEMVGSQPISCEGPSRMALEVDLEASGFKARPKSQGCLQPPGPKPRGVRYLAGIVCVQTSFEVVSKARVVAIRFGFALRRFTVVQ